jgi:nucleoside-diphosphate-sugar epimerase
MSKEVAMTRSHEPTTILVLGVTGGIGGAVAEALAMRGHAIRALVRARPGQPMPWVREWRVGDATNADAVRAAAEGAGLIVHAVNPPGYRRWREQALPMLANTIAAARASGATILFPGNVYVFSDTSPSLVDEAAVHAPTTRKGAVRREMEAMLGAAAREGVRSITLRCGDFFGPGVTSSWFARVIAKEGRDSRRLLDPTIGGAGHSWAYVPDAAEAFARLVEVRAHLPAHAVLHFEGHWVERGDAFARAIRDVIGRPDLAVRPFPHWAVRLGAPVVPLFRELAEMAWLWRHPLKLDNRALVAWIGPEPRTPLPIAIAAALDGDGLAAHSAPNASLMQPTTGAVQRPPPPSP